VQLSPRMAQRQPSAGPPEPSWGAMAMHDEAMAMKKQMHKSSWSAATAEENRNFLPVSSTPLDAQYLRSKSLTQGERLQEDVKPKMPQRVHHPSADFIKSKYIGTETKKGLPEWAAKGATKIVLGNDVSTWQPMSTVCGAHSATVVEKIDLLKTIDPMRDSTLDGPHASSMTEAHFTHMCDPFDSKHHEAAASFKSAVLLRDAYRRHTRSQYDPEDRYTEPPTAMYQMGWGVKQHYGTSCAKYTDGAVWHGRKGSHITKFSERLLLGARHHQSGPMAKPNLYY